MRDLARFGSLWLKRGSLKGEEIIPKNYALEARQNQVANLDGHYGYWWFTNDHKTLLPSAPADTFYHVGNGREDRRTVCAVIESLDLVAVVGTSAHTCDLTSDYKARPVTKVDEWISKVTAALQP